MGTFLSYFSKVFGAVGSAVDTAVPVSTGNRTAGAVLAGVALQAIPSLLPLIPAPYGPAIVALLPVLNQVIAILVPLFAVAHVTRPADVPAPAKA